MSAKQGRNEKEKHHNHNDPIDEDGNACLFWPEELTGTPKCIRKLKKKRMKLILRGKRENLKLRKKREELRMRDLLFSTQELIYPSSL